jgi:tetratricopeptide (TPR) repeat protein
VAAVIVARPALGLASGLDQASAGLAALTAGEFRKATSLLSQAIDSNELPEGQAYLFFAARGFARSAEGNYKAAVTDYSRALAAKPDYVPALYNRGNAYFSMHRYDQAIGDYSRVLEANAKDAKALNNRGAAWFCKGNLQSALANYTMAIRIAPDDPDLLLNRGKVYEAMGDPDKAREDFLRIKRIDPSVKTPLD